MKKWICLLGLIAASAWADTPPPGTVKIKGGTTGAIIGNVTDSQKVNVTNTIAATVSGTIPVTGTFFQATQPVSGTFWQATQPISGSTGRTWTLGFSGDKVDASGSSIAISNFPATQPVTGTFFQATQPVSIAGTVPVSGTFFQGTQPVSGTFWQATQPVSISGSVPVTGTFFQATQPVSGTVTADAGLNLNTSALALETGGHLATMDTKLSTINTTLGSPFQAGGSIGNSSFGISGTLPGFTVTPTFNLGTIGGASTNAAQVTAQTSLTSIDSKLTSPITVTTGGLTDTQLRATAVPVSGTFFQATQPVSGTVTSTQTALVTGQISNSAAVTTTASTFTAPANAIGFVLEAESGNTDSIRWAVGSTATASVGMLAEPGRDSGYIPLAANISVISISGTQSASVQWVIR